MATSSSYLDDASNELESDWVPAAASVNVDEEEGAVDEFGAKDFRSQMVMRDDHMVRPSRNFYSSSSMLSGT